MEDPRTGILRFGLRKVFMLFVVAIPGRAYFGKPRLLHLQRLFLDHRQAPGSYRGVKIQMCSHAAEINVKDGYSHPDHHEDSNHEMAEPLTSFSCTTFRHSFIWPRWSFLYLINWFSVHFWLFSISSYTFVESELNLKKTILMSELKNLALKWYNKITVPHAWVSNYRITWDTLFFIYPII